MSEFLPESVRAELAEAQRVAARRASRLRVSDGTLDYPVLRLWSTGFAVEAAQVPVLRGLVDLYEGSRHLGQALIVTSEEEHGERRFEFKRNTAPVDRAPLDFAQAEDAPIALLPR